jgi:hypothetical protein
LGGGRESKSLGAAPLDEWFQLQIRLTAGAYSAVATVGTSSTSTTVDAGGPALATNGLWQLETSGAWSILYDNLRCSYQ